jgi:hypothetical protein
MGDDLSYLSDVLGSSSSSTASTNGSGSSATASLNAGNANASSTDVLSDAALQPILEALRGATEEDIANLDDESVALLLQKLEQADIASDEMEKRLDRLLGQLDGMLDTLQEDTATGPADLSEKTASQEETASSGTSGAV